MKLLLRCLWCYFTQTKELFFVLYICICFVPHLVCTHLLVLIQIHYCSDLFNIFPAGFRKLLVMKLKANPCLLAQIAIIMSSLERDVLLHCQKLLSHLGCFGHNTHYSQKVRNICTGTRSSQYCSLKVDSPWAETYHSLPWQIWLTFCELCICSTIYKICLSVSPMFKTNPKRVKWWYHGIVRLVCNPMKTLSWPSETPLALISNPCVICVFFVLIPHLFLLLSIEILKYFPFTLLFVCMCVCVLP